MARESPRRLRHQEAWELLPWYVNATLTSDERQAVEEHLERCPLCRGEVAAGEDLALAVRQAAEPSPAAADRLGRLLARLDAPLEREELEAGEGGAGGEPTAVPAAAAPHPARLPRAVRWALALQAAAVLALALGFAYLLADPGAAPSDAVSRTPSDSPVEAPTDAEPTYRTLAAPAAPVAGEGLAVRAVFSPTASEEELRRLLLAAGARFAAGPSPAGVYTLEIGGDREQALAALARLRRDPRVELAEPVVVRPPAEAGP